VIEGRRKGGRESRRERRKEGRLEGGRGGLNQKGRGFVDLFENVVVSLRCQCVELKEIIGSAV